MQAANEAEELYSDWLAQAQALKGEYPSLAVEDALKNPSFGKLLLEGFSVKDAYEACNLDSVRESIRAEAARDAEARTLDRIRLHGLRPGENGANGSSGVISTSMASLTRVDADLWNQDADGVEEFYKKIDSVGNRMPKELYDELAALRNRLSK